MNDLDVSDLLTTAETARRLAASPSSIKRWADAGDLRYSVTPGGHRRFAEADVTAFRLRLMGVEGGDSPSSAWVDFLLGDTPAHDVVARLLSERGRLGSWAATAEALAPALTELGRRWEAGEISIADEHLASERLSRGLARVVETLPSAPETPRCLLALAEGEEHELGLRLVELVLRERGWRTRWAGRRTPTADIASLLAAGTLDAVGISASVSASRDVLAREAAALDAACRKAGASLLLGGRGAWPVGVGIRCLELSDLAAAAAAIERRDLTAGDPP